MPVNWQFWVVLTLYIPAMIVLFWQDIHRLAGGFLQIMASSIRSGNARSL
jgi:hypothetical protein